MEQHQAPSIGKIATKYGLILGVLSFVWFLVVTMTGMKQNWVSSVVNIVLLAVLMVLAHGEFKKTHEGMMTYPQGLGSGTLLAIIASVVTSVLLFVYVKFINTGYAEAALKMQQAELEKRGMTGAQLDQAMTMTSAMLTPVGIVVTSLVSGVIVGFIVALIVSIFTRKDDPRAVI
jgi:large-conductance mechanosensitive channel